MSKLTKTDATAAHLQLQTIQNDLFVVVDAIQKVHGATCKEVHKLLKAYDILATVMTEINDVN